MSRPFTDIVKSKSELPIKNGSVVTTTTFRGNFDTLNTYVSNNPTITDIQSKYGSRFYNGIFVRTLS